ncbi:MAG: TIGR01777 family oxidoreductase [Saprospiraceae bacterium]
MKTVLIGGGSGLVGKRLSELLRERGYTVQHLSRTPNPNAEFPRFGWDLQQGTIDQAAVERADIIINLAGEGIADGRWTPARKKRIIASRVDSTRLLIKALQQSEKQPQAFISSAAVGYYGNRGDRLLHESDEPGKGFLTESCLEWEKAIEEATVTGIRTVALRIGVVMSTQGGALEKMLIPLRFFMATYFGNGGQWYSWIHIDDLCRMFLFAIENEQLSGFYNAVAPNPETNKDLTKTLAKASGKPALVMPVPGFMLRLIFGEMADTILFSTRVTSEKIEQAGFEFRFPRLEPALRDLLARKI